MSEFKMREPEDESDRKLLDDVAAFGWHIVGVEADHEGPDFAFSVGMHYTLEHPEIMLMGLSPQVSAHLINAMGDSIRGGEKFEPGRRYDDIAAQYSLAFVNVEQRYYKEYLGYALWFYRSFDFPVLQCIWPDKAGVFPWEADYDSRFFDLQRVLGAPNREVG